MDRIILNTLVAAIGVNFFLEQLVDASIIRLPGSLDHETIVMWLCLTPILIYGVLKTMTRTLSRRRGEQSIEPTDYTPTYHCQAQGEDPEPVAGLRRPTEQENPDPDTGNSGAAKGYRKVVLD